MAKILLADDDATFRKMLRLTLEALGHQVVTADNGKEALELLETDPCDLVITDIVMPEQDGMEVIVALRKSHPQTPIIAVSGGARIDASDYLVMARRLGVAQTLEKPFTDDALVSAISVALKQKLKSSC